MHKCYGCEREIVGHLFCPQFCPHCNCEQLNEIQQEASEIIARAISQMAETLWKMREILKRKSMIYQYDLKIAAMKKFNLTFEQVNIEYAEWAKIREQLLTNS